MQRFHLILNKEQYKSSYKSQSPHANGIMESRHEYIDAASAAAPIALFVCVSVCLELMILFLLFFLALEYETASIRDYIH